MRRFLLLLLGVVCLAGCATPPVSLTRNDMPREQDAVVVSTIRSEAQVTFVLSRLDRFEVGPEMLVEAYRPPTLKILRMKPGRYSISDVKSWEMAGTLTNSAEYAFDIEAGKINYIGDIILMADEKETWGVPWQQMSSQIMHFNIVDLEPETIAAAKERHPRLFEELSVRNAVPESRRGREMDDKTRSKFLDVGNYLSEDR